MTVVYFDSSALVKLFLPEAGSAVVGGLWDGCDLAVSSRLTYPEVAAAVAAAGRRGVMAGPVTDVVAAWASIWEELRPVELSRSVEQAAGACAVRFALRGADAVHLASALALGDSSVLVATWDRQLSTAARSAGLAVVPAHP